jgi:hypothetical protein
MSKIGCLIEIRRGTAYADKLRAYQVELDGNIIGQIGDEESKSFEVSKGVHDLRLRIDWARSNSVQFDMAENSTVHFRCASHLKGANVLLASVYALLMPHKYIELERVD